MAVGKPRFWALLCALVWGCLLATASGTERCMLFRNGKTDYRIVVSSKASDSEKHAATELQYYLNKISGATFPVGETPGTKNIFIGHRSDMAAMADIPQPNDDDDGFVYDVEGQSLVIYGGRHRGTMYGVYAFLENELGVHWYAQDCTIIPKLKAKQLRDIHRHDESPAFKYRCLLAYPVNISHELTAHFRLNEVWFSKAAEQAVYGKVNRYWGAHTMGSHFIPAKDYFHSHPEYFALWEGKRISDGQLCLSNAEVLRICISKMRDVMQHNPDYIAYELSQNDNKRYWYYAHLRQNRPFAENLKEGDTVKAGDVIGYVGRTGYSDTENTNGITESHLHIGLELVFNEKQKESDNEIWIDVSAITSVLEQHQSAVLRNSETKEFTRQFEYNEK